MSTALGDYLRARRALVDPAAAGIRVSGVRRTPGLRREEVATLAVISADYYLRLEQGRDRNPSRQVLESLARVFGLDTTATQHLLSLPTAPVRSRSRRPPQPKVDVGTLQLLVIYHAEPGSETARFLALLGSLAAGERIVGRRLTAA